VPGKERRVGELAAADVEQTAVAAEACVERGSLAGKPARKRRAHGIRG